MHIPVLLEEVVKGLNIMPGKKYIDATANGGGHLFAIAERIGNGGRILGIEWDKSIFENLETKVKSSDLNQRIIVVNDSYTNLVKIAEEKKFKDCDGITFDLGMSSWQIEESGRGFSFMRDEPLDMRFFQNNESTENGKLNSKTAADILNSYSEEELEKIFKEYGEESFAKQIAFSIFNTRKLKPIKTTFELVEIIKNSVPFWYRARRIHPATKTFQALRIVVNHELENIQEGLERALEVLAPSGRLAVISFHSLEDRVVKNFFRDKSKKEKVSKYKKDEVVNQPILKLVNKKTIKATLAEIIKNPRARSAKLRVVEKIAHHTN